MDDIETRVRKLVAARFGVEECDIRLDSDFRTTSVPSRSR